MVKIIGAWNILILREIGYANDDSVLNILDIVIIANVILGSEDFTVTADINLDGLVNILDIVSLAEMILNAIDD